MEIARLEVSTQQHLERMQETAKVNYIQYGRSTKAKKGKKPLSGAGASSAGASSHRGSKPSGKGKKSPFPLDTCYRCGNADNKKHRTAKLWMQHAEDVERKDTMRRFVSRKNAPHTI